MKTIEELRVEKTYYRREKDILGNIVRTPYQKKVRREPIVVTQGVRFGYYLLDVVFFYILQFILTFVFVFIYAASVGDTHPMIVFLNDYGTIISLFLFFLYYALTEFFLGGTFSKLIFGYTVIDQYAERISFGRSALRTISRFVPFEAFSCLGERGWHDQWSKTYVVKRTERDALKKLLNTMHDGKDILD